MSRVRIQNTASNLGLSKPCGEGGKATATGERDVRSYKSQRNMTRNSLSHRCPGVPGQKDVRVSRRWSPQSTVSAGTTATRVRPPPHPGACVGFCFTFPATFSQHYIFSVHLSDKRLRKSTTTWRVHTGNTMALDRIGCSLSGTPNKNPSATDYAAEERLITIS